MGAGFAGGKFGERVGFQREGGEEVVCFGEEGGDGGGGEGGWSPKRLYMLNPTP